MKRGTEEIAPSEGKYRLGFFGPGFLTNAPLEFLDKIFVLDRFVAIAVCVGSQ